MPNNDNHHKGTQTLDAAFARLAVSLSTFDPPPLDFDQDVLCRLNAGVKTVPFDLFALHPYNQRTIHGQGQLGWNSTITNKVNGGSSQSRNSNDGQWNSSWSVSGGYTSSSSGEFLESEASFRQNGFGRGLSSLSLSNGVSFELQRNSNLNGAVDEFMVNGSSVQGMSGNRTVSFCLSDLQGKIVLLAKDKHGSRVLKEKMELLAPDQVSFFFKEIINDVIDLMVDPFGNHVVMRVVEICNEQQRNFIIEKIINNCLQFVKICLNPHGIRVVEKLLEHVTTDQQQALIVIGLIPVTVALAKDVNGNRVILYCLQHFSQEQSKILLIVVGSKCFEIAADKTGCCMLQDCIKYAQGMSKLRLIAEIIVNVSFLAEDCYGNYVVQHILSLQISAVTENVLKKLEGKFFRLASNKYGSNVVEKLLQFSEEHYSTRIIVELLSHPNVARLLMDPYGNYVMQTALITSKGAIRSFLVNLIQLNSPMMRSNIYGKKVLERFHRINKLRHT